jgi:hypothetical protein
MHGREKKFIEIVCRKTWRKRITLMALVQMEV